MANLTGFETEIATSRCCAIPTQIDGKAAFICEEAKLRFAGFAQKDAVRLSDFVRKDLGPGPLGPRSGSHLLFSSLVCSPSTPGLVATLYVK